jgi:nicotinamidase-related amidase
MSDFAFRLPVAETALIVIDIQVDFCSPEGSTAKRGRPNTLMQLLPPKINSFVNVVQPLGMPIVFTKAVVDETNLPDNLRFFNQLKGIHRPTQKDSGGEELYQLDIPPDSHIITKTYADAFALTELNNLLKRHGIRNLLICGVRTEICVDATARRACAEGYNVFVISDLVATRDDKLSDQQYALKFLDAYYAFVMNSEAIMQAIYQPE